MSSTSPTSLHAGQPMLHAGAPLDQAKALVILVHGRGASADDIIGLANHLKPEGDAGDAVAWVAPQAAGNVWYPYRFTEPIALNQEALDSAIEVVDGIIDQAVAAGIPAERVMVAGFSQGGCLALEYAWRGKHRIGAAAALSGGLVGKLDTDSRPAADLRGMPIFVGMGSADQIVPLSQIEQSVSILREAGADVNYQLYPRLGHSIVREETDIVREMVANLVDSETAS